MRAGYLAAAAALLLMIAGRAEAGPALLFDPENGRILYAEDQDATWHPASLTKIMTAYLTFEALKQGRITLDQRIPYSELAAEQPPSKLGLSLTAQLTVESALKALIIKSANDVAVMLAEAVNGSQPGFVAQMNNTAQRLGMTRTNFVNPNGLPALQQVTTARDLAKLARAVIKDFPEYAGYWSLEEARIGNSIRLATHNGLLRTFEGADGMKTGFICDSGYNVVGTATRDGRKLIAVVLGEQSGAARTVRAASLLEHGFHEYAWKAIFPAPTIDDAPLSTDSISVTSVRETIYAGDCGNSRRAVARARKKKGRKTLAADSPAAVAADPAGQLPPEQAPVLKDKNVPKSATTTNKSAPLQAAGPVGSPQKATAEQAQAKGQKTKPIVAAGQATTPPTDAGPKPSAKTEPHDGTTTPASQKSAPAALAP